MYSLPRACKSFLCFSEYLTTVHAQNILCSTGFIISSNNWKHLFQGSIIGLHQKYNETMVLICMLHFIVFSMQLSKHNVSSFCRIFNVTLLSLLCILSDLPLPPSIMIFFFHVNIDTVHKTLQTQECYYIVQINLHISFITEKKFSMCL